MPRPPFDPSPKVKKLKHFFDVMDEKDTGKLTVTEFVHALDIEDTTFVRGLIEKTVPLRVPAATVAPPPRVTRQSNSKPRYLALALGRRRL